MPSAKAPSTAVADSTPSLAPTREAPAPSPGDDEGAILVVAKKVVDSCQDLRTVAEGTRGAEPDNVWVVILESLTECLTNGGLKAHRLLVSGDAEHRDIVRLVMAAKGAPMDRVVVRAPAQEKCGDKPCQPDPRVDITLLP